MNANFLKFKYSFCRPLGSTAGGGHIAGPNSLPSSYACVLRYI